jgi:SsrA-binding protein
MNPIKNRKASFDYSFIEDFTAGVCLYGSEVKAIRESRVSLVDAFCFIQDGEVWVKGMHISADSKDWNHDPLRAKKLLLKKKEISKLQKGLDKGITIVPTLIFLSDRNLIKVKIALAKGRKEYDKRERIKEREIEREIKNI